MNLERIAALLANYRIGDTLAAEYVAHQLLQAACRELIEAVDLIEPIGTNPCLDIPMPARDGTTRPEQAQAIYDRTYSQRQAPYVPASHGKLVNRRVTSENPCAEIPLPQSGDIYVGEPFTRQEEQEFAARQELAAAQRELDELTSGHVDLGPYGDPGDDTPPQGMHP